MSFESNGSLKFLIYDRTGWIGGLLGKLCEGQGIEYTYGSGRLENRTSLEQDLETIKPTHVFNAAGCIFEYDQTHTLGSGVGFKEEDTPNFIGSFYSKTKAMARCSSQS